MKTTIITALFFSFLVFFNQTTPAQSPDKIFKNAAKAMGGEKALRNVTSTKTSGRITRIGDNSGGRFQSQAAQPNLYTSSFDLNGFETAAGYNGKSGWSRDSKTGSSTITGAAARDFQAESNYRNNRWFNYKKEKSKIVYGGKFNVNGKSADTVILRTAKGTIIKMYFDTVTGLLIRDEISAGDFNNTFDYSDFRAVDGILEPFTIVSTISDEKYEIKLDSIVRNEQIAKSAFDFPKISDEPLPDIAAVLKEVRANQEKIEDILENYAYTQTITSREVLEDGSLRDLGTRTVQMSFYKGNRISRLVAVDGEPLSTDEQVKEDVKVEKRVAEIEKQIIKKQARTAGQSSGQSTQVNRGVSAAEILRASNLTNPRRENFRGRDAIVFDFEPNPNFDFKNVNGRLKAFGKMAGVMWIDAEDKQMVRLEAVLAENFKLGGGIVAKVQKGAAFIFENARVNDEIWLPSLRVSNASAKVLLVKGININQTAEFSDYHKFETEVKESKIDEVREP